MESVARSIIVIASLGRTIVLFVVKVGTKLEIAQISKVNTRVVVKNVVIMLMLRRIIVFLLSNLEVRKRLLSMW